MILSESMKYLTMGKWWLALFPGILLVLVVMLFHVIGDTLNSLLIRPGHMSRENEYKKQKIDAVKKMIMKKNAGKA